MDKTSKSTTILKVISIKEMLSQDIKFARMMLWDFHDVIKLLFHFN